jgi:mono/diheme cytochrome c family protein
LSKGNFQINRIKANLCAGTAFLMLFVGTCLAAKAESSAEDGNQLFHSRALGSPYTTGIPYALWLSMMERYPQELGADWNEFRDKYGLLADPSRPRGLPVGFVLYDTKFTATRFLMTNCSLCHTGEINGQVITGLGSRTIRIHAFNNAIMQIAKRADFNPKEMLPLAASAAHLNNVPWGWRSRYVTRKAIKQLKSLSASYVEMDAGPGRSGVLEFTKAILKQPVHPPYGFIRIHPLWTYKKRESFGVDGVMKGDLGGALASVEFNKGMPAKYIVSHPNQWASLYKYVKTIEPPKFPAAIDSSLAKRGEQVSQTACARCHGTYSPGTETYKEKVISLSHIGTDPDRIRSITPELLTTTNKSIFGKYVQLANTGGYVAPPLDGIWCRGPYLHNGSVPTLADLLLPAAQRPVSFFVGGDTAYDIQRLGVAYTEDITPDGSRRGIRVSAKQIEFDTRAPGNSSEGHEFSNKLSEADSKALLEYLKTL